MNNSGLLYTMEYEDRVRCGGALNGKPDCCIVNEYNLNEEELKILNLNEHGVLACNAKVVANFVINQEAANIVGEHIVGQQYRVNTYNCVRI